MQASPGLTRLSPDRRTGPHSAALGGVGVTKAGELGADPVGVRMLQFVEDLLGLALGIPRGGQLSRTVAVVAETGKGGRYVEAVSEFPEEFQRVAVAAGGFAEVPKLVLDVAETVP